MEQLNEWEAFDRIEQIGEYRQDYRIASLSSLIYNVASSFGSSKGRRKVAKPQDFMYWMNEKDFKKSSEGESTQSLEEMKAVVYAIAGAAKKEGRLKEK